MCIWLGFTVCARRWLIAWRYGIAKCAVGERPWCLLTRGVLEAGLDALNEGVHGGKGGVDVRRRIRNEVQPAMLAPACAKNYGE